MVPQGFWELQSYFNYKKESHYYITFKISETIVHHFITDQYSKWSTIHPKKWKISLTTVLGPMAIGRSKILKVTICFWALYVYTSVCMWNTDLSRWKRYQKFTPVIWRVAICPKVLQTYPPQVNQKTAFLFNFQRLLSRQHPRARIKKYRDNLTGWQWLP